MSLTKQGPHRVGGWWWCCMNDGEDSDQAIELRLNAQTLKEEELQEKDR